MNRRRLRVHLCVVSSALLLAACKTAMPENFTLTDRLVVPEIGAGMTPECNAPLPPMPPPMTELIAGKTYDENVWMWEKVRPVANYAMLASGRYLASGAKQDRDAIVEMLLSWSRGKGITIWGPEWLATSDSSWSTYYYSMSIVFPMVQAYGLVRSDMSASEVAEVDAWLGGRIRELNYDATGAGGSKQGMWTKASRQDNKSYKREAMNMAWGIVVGDRRMFERGITAYHNAISDLRRDGSFRKESERGGNAISYTIIAIQNLVSIAEMARAQGIDLYSVAKGDKDIHLAVSFLMDVIEDPKIIAPYARRKSGGSSSNYSVENQNLYNLKKVLPEYNQKYETAFGWAENYAALFPDSPFVPRMRKAAPWLQDGTPVIHYGSGVNIACLMSLEKRTAAS